MGWSFTLFTGIVLVSGAIALIVGVATYRQRPHPMAGPLTLLMVSVALWAIPDAISFGYDTLEEVLFWQRISYFGVVSAPVMFLVVILNYAGYDKWLSRPLYVLLGSIPVISLVAVWTDGQHNLLWHSHELAESHGASVLISDLGIWFWIQLGYLYLVVLAGLFMLGYVVATSDAVYRKQAGLIFIGGVVPLATNVVMQFGIGPDPMVDLTTTALTVSGITFAVAIFHLDLLDIRPVARDELIDALEDGVVVVGRDGRVREFNPAAAEVLGDIEVEQPADDVLPAAVLPDGGEIVIDTDDGKRHYRVRSTTISDKRGQSIGWTVYLNDVTALIEHEQRISVLNRVLRHNIRNEMNIVLGHLTELEVTTHETADHRSLDAAKTGSQRVIEFAEKARLVGKTLHDRDSATVIEVDEVVLRVVADETDRFPQADIVCEDLESSQGNLTVHSAQIELLELAIRELIENAIVHNDKETPTIAITLTADAEAVHIKIADNGPGIPLEETAVLNYTTESDLDHTSGLGLWLVQWTASLSGGSVSFMENEPAGTIVQLTLPKGMK